jgi:hypothetical protein
MVPVAAGEPEHELDVPLELHGSSPSGGAHFGNPRPNLAERTDKAVSVPREFAARPPQSAAS